MADQALPTIRQLRYLTAIAETKHFRRAAELMGVSQPSLSAQLQTLEELLGARLVERSRAGVALTPLGREVVERSNIVLEEVQGIVDFASVASHGLTGTIRLGAKPTLGPYLLPHVVARLHRRHKDLKLYVRESSPRELEQELNAGLHDLILAQLPIVGQDFVTESLFREPLFLAMASDHPLAAKTEVTASDLKGLGVLSLSPQYHLYDQIATLCDSFGASLLRDYEGTSLDALRQMVGMGMGVTFLPALYVQTEIPARGDVVVKRLKGRDIYRVCGLAWRKSAGRVAAYHQIAEIMKDVASKRFKDLRVEA